MTVSGFDGHTGTFWQVPTEYFAPLKHDAITAQRKIHLVYVCVIAP